MADNIFPLPPVDPPSGGPVEVPAEPAPFVQLYADHTAGCGHATLAAAIEDARREVKPGEAIVIYQAIRIVRSVTTAQVDEFKVPNGIAT